MTSPPRSTRIAARYRNRRQVSRLTRELALSARLRSEVSARVATSPEDHREVTEALRLASGDVARRESQVAALRTVRPFG